MKDLCCSCQIQTYSEHSDKNLEQTILCLYNSSGPPVIIFPPKIFLFPASWSEEGEVLYYPLFVRLSFHLSQILNPGSLSSEDFLIWACLIEKESSYLQLGGWPSDSIGKKSKVTLFFNLAIKTMVSRSQFFNAAILKCSTVLLLWQVGLIANVKLHFYGFFFPLDVFGWFQ